MVSPFAVVLAALPIYLIYSTLKVPALERKTETDQKTGLFNDQYFQHALQIELDRANRFGRPITVAMADMDLLRNINNTYGHLAGDEVLIGVARILKGSFRDVDTVARFGGEEFAILMPETTPVEIYAHIDEVRQKIQDTEFMVETSVTPIHVTLSFGIAGREEQQVVAKELIHNADSALYHAKLNGRNRAYIYTTDGYQALFQQTSQGSKPTHQGRKTELNSQHQIARHNKPTAQQRRSRPNRPKNPRANRPEPTTPPGTYTPLSVSWRLASLFLCTCSPIPYPISLIGWD